MTSFNLRRAAAWVACVVAASVVACSEPDEAEVFLDDPYAYREHEPDFLSPDELAEFYAVQDATLDVDLTGGGGFVFTGVPADAYYRLMLAEASEQTKDAYFRAAIYPSYPYTEK